jgi:hypothetical protein
MSTIKLPELPAPFEPEWPDLNPHALGCGVEDRGIVSRYEAAEYGFQDGVDKAAQCVPEDVYTGEQMRAYADQAAQDARSTAIEDVACMICRRFDLNIPADLGPELLDAIRSMAATPEKDHGEST